MRADRALAIGLLLLAIAVVLTGSQAAVILGLFAALVAIIVATEGA